MCFDTCAFVPLVVYIKMLVAFVLFFAHVFISIVALLAPCHPSFSVFLIKLTFDSTGIPKRGRLPRGLIANAARRGGSTERILQYS